MDIVANSLSAKVLRTKEVLVNGTDIMEYFSKKLSAGVQFIGVFDSLSDALSVNGGIVLIQNDEYTRDYIWSELCSKWFEIGNEGLIGELQDTVNQLTTDMGNVTADIESLANVSSEYQLSAAAGTMAYQQLSDFYKASDTSSSSELCGEFSAVSNKVDTVSNQVSDINDIRLSAQSAVPQTLTVNGIALTSNIILSADRIQYTADKTVSAALSQKADLVAGATSGDIAVLDENGSIADSGKALSDLQEKLVFDALPTDGSPNVVSSGGIWSAIQDASPENYAEVSAQVYQNKGDISTISGDVAKKSTVSVDNVQSDLNVVHMSYDEYAQVLSGDVPANTLYILSGQTIDAYGMKITGVLSSEDPTDAATYGQVLEVKQTINSLSTYSDIATKLSADGYVTSSQTSSVGELEAKFNSLSTYSDIATKLSADGYALTSQTSSATELETKFNSLSTYSDIATKLSADGYALTSQTSSVGELEAKFNSLSTYSDISAQLSNDGYATSDWVDEQGYLTDVPDAYKTYNITLSTLSSDGYATSSQVGSKLDSSAAAPVFDSSASYQANQYVTYGGGLWRFLSAHTGDWNPADVVSVDMTSPDATLDIMANGSLRVVAADGTSLWQQGYTLQLSSSTVLSNTLSSVIALSTETVNKCNFGINNAGIVCLTFPKTVAGKVADFILDVTNPALSAEADNYPAAFLSTNEYQVSSKVLYDNKCWVCILSVSADTAWSGSSNWATTQLSVDTTNNSFVVAEGESLQDMLLVNPGTLSRYYFTQTAFNLNSLPTWQVFRQVVEEAS